MSDDAAEIKKTIQEIDTLLNHLISINAMVKALLEGKTSEQLAEFCNVTPKQAEEALTYIRRIPDATTSI